MQTSRPIKTNNVQIKKVTVEEKDVKKREHLQFIKSIRGKKKKDGKTGFKGESDPK